MPPAPEGTNPLTGQEASEKYAATHRPVAVVVANDKQALPQRGLSKASVLFEAEAERGATRLLAVYPSLVNMTVVGPVSSTHDVFVQLGLPLDAYLSHIGTTVYASNLLNLLAYEDLDGHYLGKTAYSYDYDRTLPRPGGKLNEDCFFTSKKKLVQAVQDSGIRTKGDVRQLFLFDEEEPKAQTSAEQVDITFAKGAKAGFLFREKDGVYVKSIFGKTHADEDGKALTFKNVIVLDCDTDKKPDGVNVEYDLRGGTGTWFTMGGAQAIRWVKGAPEDPLMLFDEDGDMLAVQPGKSYVALVSTDHGKLSYGEYVPDDSSSSKSSSKK